jgi:putative transposase
MARKKRFYRIDSCHHVMLRGNGGQDLFLDIADRVRFCLLLQAASEKYTFRVHAFCFMKNHVHLMLEPLERPLQDGVHSFSFRYAQYFNAKYGKRGYLYQGRFRSICVQDGTYFKRLIRYIHLNPVHAGLVQKPENYQWSSYRAFLGHDHYVWLCKERVLSNFGPTYKESLDYMTWFIYQQIDIEAEAAEIKNAFHIGIFEEKDPSEQIERPQSSPFKDLLTTCMLDKAVDFVCSHYNLSSSDLSSSSRKSQLVEARACLALIVQKSKNLNFSELGRLLARDPSSISRLASKANSREDLRQLANTFVNAGTH